MLLYEGKYFGLHWDVTRMPIYPIFLSLVRLVSDSVNFVIIIQNILFISASIIFYKIYKEIFTDRFTVLIAIFFTCINLNLIFASSFILTESIYVLFVSLFIYYFIKYLKDYDSKIKYVILLSLTLMLCYFTRPIAYYYIVLVFVFFTKEQNIKKCIRDVSIFFTLVKYLVSIYGLKMINKENYRIFIFFGLFILINLLLTSSFGSARYRLPYEILLIIIFSSGLRNLFKLTK